MTICTTCVYNIELNSGTIIAVAAVAAGKKDAGNCSRTPTHPPTHPPIHPRPVIGSPLDFLFGGVGGEGRCTGRHITLDERVCVYPQFVTIILLYTKIGRCVRVCVCARVGHLLRAAPVTGQWRAGRATAAGVTVFRAFGLPVDHSTDRYLRAHSTSA